MPIFDKEYWIDLLQSVHTLNLDGGVNCNWQEWAKSILAKTRESADQIPVESMPEYRDGTIMEIITRNMQLPRIGSEALALDRIWHGLKDGTMACTKALMAEIFFLLYRLQEGFGPKQAWG